MGRKSKDVFSYADELWRIVEAVAVEGAELEVVVPNLSTARRLRGKFYTFRQGLDLAIKEARLNPKSPHGQMVAKLENTLQWARVTVCYFEEPTRDHASEPVRVRYMHKNKTPDAGFYRQALASSVITAPPDLEAQLEASAKRVADEVEKDTPLKKDNPYY